MFVPKFLNFISYAKCADWLNIINIDNPFYVKSYEKGADSKY